MSTQQNQYTSTHAAHYTITYLPKARRTRKRPLIRASAVRLLNAVTEALWPKTRI